MRATALIEKREQLGLSVTQIGTKARVSDPIVRKAEDALMPANHPYLPRLAAAYELTVDAFIETQSKKVKLMSDIVVKRIAGGGVARGSKLALRGSRAQTATATISGPMRVGKSANGKLAKKFNHKVRSTARGLVTTANLLMMRGKEHGDFEGVPLEQFAVILNDWLAMNGVRDLVISESFAGVFD